MSVAYASATPDDQGSTIRYRLYVTGSARVVTVTYTLHYDPSDEVLQQWNEQVKAAQAAWDSKRDEEAFDRARRQITARSRVRPRPPNDLRDEERYELLNRIVGEAFRGAPSDALPAPVEVELVHRYFDIASLFYFVHPAWWRPRARGARQDYDITDESEPARFGSSIGWTIQVDGDRRRNEFLNSPWVRVCVPVRPGVEREAIAWLAEHVEGRQGFSTDPGAPVGKLLAAIEARRAAENAAAPGPDYVTTW